MGDPVGGPVNRRTMAWAIGFHAAALVVALGLFPGADSAAQGPRIGLTVALATMGAVLLVGAFTAELQARTARLDGKGVCPVGAKCACGHFNFKPRSKCRQCGAATSYAS